MFRAPLPSQIALLLNAIVAVWTLAAGAAPAAFAEDVPIRKCDRLPIIDVKVAGRSSRFLLDTGGTSFLNIASFAIGASKSLAVTSVNGTIGSVGREVVVSELAVGNQRLYNLKLPAIDLSAISKACGAEIDGIFGVDMLEATGATLDLRRRTASFPSSGGEPGGEENSTQDTRLLEARQDLESCVAALNRGDEKTLAECFDPDAVVFTFESQLYGRDRVLEYFQKNYFHTNPPAQVEIAPRTFHPVGDVIWFDYDLRVRRPSEVLQATGMAMCRKSGGHWRVLNMHHSAPARVSAAVR